MESSGPFSLPFEFCNPWNFDHILALTFFLKVALERCFSKELCLFFRSFGWRDIFFCFVVGRAEGNGTFLSFVIVILMISSHTYTIWSLKIAAKLKKTNHFCCSIIKKSLCFFLPFIMRIMKFDSDMAASFVRNLRGEDKKFVWGRGRRRIAREGSSTIEFVLYNIHTCVF